MIFKCPACKHIINTFFGPFWITTPVKCPHCGQESVINFGRHTLIYFAFVIFVLLLDIPKNPLIWVAIFIFTVVTLYLVFYYYFVGLVPVKTKEEPKEIAKTPAWTCSWCGEKHRQEFDSCWQCGRERK